MLVSCRQASDPRDLWVIVGGLMIIAAIGVITWREAALNRRGVTPPVEAIEV